jgi:N-acetylglucosamine kinase-like BadF-type ATPase
MKILIVESGSTKTEWRLISSPDIAFESFFSEGINPYYQSLTEICKAQQSIFEKIEPKEIHFIYYYGTGITNEEMKEVIRDFFYSHFLQSTTIIIENDLVAALKANLGEEAGIACILGTGSNSGYFDGNKITEQIPPLGFWLGDEGSGGHLGKSLLLAYLHNEMPTDIRELFIKRYGTLSRLDILGKAYKVEFPNRWFASYSKFLFDHRKNEFCYRIIEKSFDAFVQLYLVKYSQVKNVPIHFTGSVAFYYSDILKKVLKKHQIQVGIISESPMAGLTMFHKNQIWPKSN